MEPIVLTQAACMVFWGLWLALAAFNSCVDSATNRTLLANMISMAEIKPGEALGQGLLSRAVRDPGTSSVMLKSIIVAQLLIALAMATAGGNFWVSGGDPASVRIAGYALLAFGSLWAFFLLGGLWFGYWIKTPQVQQVHFTLLLGSLLTFIVINFKP